ncbi:hypothetical protein MicvaDRAFT_3212 [Microcoleus vaginatus FGP-2]|nr:hypothetical protein MicvaDRAFT_3212 [Microcoleus vaginatus FGP-2]
MGWDHGYTVALFFELVLDSGMWDNYFPSSSLESSHVYSHTPVATAFGVANLAGIVGDC